MDALAAIVTLEISPTAVVTSPRSWGSALLELGGHEEHRGIQAWRHGLI
jgi:hypothetical protein